MTELTPVKIVRLAAAADIGKIEATAREVARESGVAGQAGEEFVSGLSEMAYNLYLRGSKRCRFAISPVRQEGGRKGVQAIAVYRPAQRFAKPSKWDDLAAEWQLRKRLVYVKSMMDNFDVSSTSDGGTRIVAQKMA